MTSTNDNLKDSIEKLLEPAKAGCDKCPPKINDMCNEFYQKYDETCPIVTMFRVINLIEMEINGDKR